MRAQAAWLTAASQQLSTANEENNIISRYLPIYCFIYWIVVGDTNIHIVCIYIVYIYVHKYKYIYT